MKRILSFLICLCLFTSAMSIAGFAADTDTDYAKAYDMLSSLGINGDINTDPNAQITRAEFAALSVRALDLEGLNSYDGSFTDVSESAPFAAEIYTAKSLRMSQGTAEGVFSPNEAVPVPVAAKMMLTAMGYENIAVANGGYPVGYLAIASKVKLLRGIDASGNLTIRDAYVLVYNALNADMPVFDAISGGDMEFSVVSGRNILTENFGLTKISGIVSAVGFMSIEDTIADTNEITIGNKKYICNIPAEKYFGRNVDAWIDAKTNEIRAFDIGYDNKEVVINAKDVSGYANYKLETYEDDKIKTYTMEKSFTFIKNGRAIVHNNTNFVFDSGSLTLVDNNGNGKYDYVIAEDIEYFIVSRINSVNKLVHDPDSDIKSLNLESDSDYCAKLVNADGTAASIEDIVAGTLLEVMQSDDGVYTIARIVKNNQLTATITEISQNGFVANGVEYETNAYFNTKNPRITLDNEYRLILASDGTVTNIVGENESDMKYGYMLNFGKSGTGLNSKVQIKLLTADNTKEIYELKENINFNGSSNVSCNSSELEALFVSDGIPNYQLIRYRLNTENKITDIDTLVEDDKWILNSDTDDKDCLTRYVKQETVRYRNNVQYAVPYFTFQNAVTFMVPKDLANADPAVSHRIFEDEMFYVAPVSTELNNNKNYVVDAYDFDENYRPRACAAYKTTAANIGGEVIEENVSYMVQNIVDTSDEEGNLTKAIYVYGDKKYTKLIVDYRALGNIVLPSNGDVIRYARGPEGYVNSITVDIDYIAAANPKDSTIEILNTDAPETYTSFAAGNVLKISSNVMTLVQPNPELGKNGIAPIAVRGSTYYTVFNKTTGEVRAATASEIVEAGTIDAIADSSYVAVRLNYYVATNVYIYLDN